MDPAFPQCSAGTPGRSSTVDPSFAAWEALRLLAAGVLCGAFIAGNLAALFVDVPPDPYGYAKPAAQMSALAGALGGTVCAGWFVMAAAAWRLFRGRGFMEIPDGWLPVRGRWLRYLIFAVPMLLPLPFWLLNFVLWVPLWWFLLLPCPIVRRIIEPERSAYPPG